MRVKYYEEIKAYAVVVIDSFRKGITIYCDSYKYDEGVKWLTLMRDGIIVCSLWDDNAIKVYKLLEEIEK